MPLISLLNLQFRKLLVKIIHCPLFQRSSLHAFGMLFVMKQHKFDPIAMRIQ